MDSIKAILALAAVAVVGISAHAQNLIVVNSDGSGDFTEIQSAIDFASDDDVIQVINSGSNYERFNLDNKSLVLVGVGKPVVGGDLFGSLTYIHNLDAQRSVALDGIDFTCRVVIFDNFGPVWLEDMEVDPLVSPFLPTPVYGLLILENAAVSLTRVDVQGAPALDISDSDVFIYDSSISGSEGLAGYSTCDPSPFCGICDSADGEVGYSGIVAMDDSFVYLSNSTVRGGAGGQTGHDSQTGICPTCTFAGRGGDAILTGEDTRVEYLDSQIIAGVAGATLPSCTLFTGSPGSTIVHAFNGEDVELPGTSVSFEASNLNKVGDPVSIKFTGEPLGHLVYLQIATSQSPLYMPPLEGAWLIEQTAPFFFFGTIPASGTLELTRSFMPLGTPVLPIYAQGIFVDFPGGIRAAQFSSPSLLIAYE